MTPGRWVIMAGCLYEVAALVPGSPLPTITEMIKAVGRHPVARVLVWTWCGYVAWHFLEPTP